jgi:hypothetical protein
VRARQAAAIIASVIIVLAAYAIWYRATEVFNPNPSPVTIDTSSSCSRTAPPCPAFGIGSANLTVRVVADIISQQLVLKIIALGPTEVSRFSAYFSGIPIGNLTGVIQPGQASTEAWAIPTTINVTVGTTYTVSLESVYLDPHSGAVSADYWVQTQVTAA